MKPVVVVGGGLSGLTAAWRLHRAGLPVTLLEGSARLGGVVRRGPVGADGPVVDLGAESLLARRPEAVDLATELGLADRLQPPATSRAAIYSRGRLHPMPGGHVMGVPGDADALAGLLEPAELERLRAGLERPGEPVTGDVSVAHWLSDRLGPGVVDRLVEPLLGGVYAGRVERLGVQAALPALWPVALSGEPIGPAVRRLTAAARAGAGGPVFLGLRGGVATLVEALAAALSRDGVSLRTYSPVTALCAPTIPGADWLLGVGPAHRQSYLPASAVLLALPAAASARLLGQVAETATAAAFLADTQLASMALVAATLPAGTLASCSPEAELSGVLVPAVEGRLVKAMTFTSQKWAWAGGGPDILRLSVGRAGESTVLHRSDADLAGEALVDAGALLDRDLAPLASRVVRWGGGLPQYDVAHLDRMQAARAELDRVTGLEVCGSVWNGVGIPACVATATAAAARLYAEVG